WREEYAPKLSRLEKFVREMTRSILGAWDRATSRWSLGRLFGRSRPTVVLTLDFEHLELREHLAPDDALKHLRQISLGPQAMLEASLALSELEGIHAKGAAG